MWFSTVVLFVLFTLTLVYLGKQNQHSSLNVSDIASHKSKSSTSQTETAPLVLVKENSHLEQNIDTINKKNIHNNSLKNIDIKKESTLTKQNTSYLLSIIKTKDYATIDHLKAELILLGLNPNIVSVNQNGVIYYAINLGPYKDKEKAYSEEKRLQQNNIRSTILKTTNSI